MKMWLTIATCALLIFLCGCAGDGSPASSQPAPPAGMTEDAAQTADASSAPTPPEPAISSPLPSAAPESEPSEAEELKNVISVASPQSEEIAENAPKAAAPVKDPEPTPAPATGTWAYEADGYTFDPAHPTLMGIPVGADLDLVKRMFGEPETSHLLPDEDLNAAVFRYKGFAVGISDKKVLFVEVYSASVDPGLNGVTIGVSREYAIGSLGVPTTESPYVLLYSGNGAILRLDLDPHENTVHSMKLFPASE